MKINNDRYIASVLNRFAKEREWQQFHTPKNLAMALSVEVAEIVELYQWHKHSDDVQPDPAKVRAEIADVQIYLIMLADKLNIDIGKAVLDKIKINAEKYPVESSRGKSDKYTNLEN